MNIPIFPLRAVLFPHARMPLQIFEPRYLDMIKQCMKTQTPFGVVRICHGSEVINAGVQESLDIEFVGTIATIVDFDALPNNRLQIVIEGGEKFQINDTAIARDQLISADVSLSPMETPRHLPQCYEHMGGMLSDLASHSSIAPLGFSIDLNDAVKVANHLSSLLPIDSALQQELLEQDTCLQRLEILVDIIEQLQD